MGEDRCDACGVLSAFKYKLNILKLAESCLGAGQSRCKPCSEFATLQGRVQEVEQTLLNLKAAQQSLISIINFHHSSFIRNIPNEVVQLIFSLCHDRSPSERGCSDSEESQSPRFRTLILGAVCKRWREIAWGMPELWTSLRIPNVPEGSHSAFSLQVELAKEWLGRSSNLPLRISLETQVPSRNPKFNPHVGELIEVLNSYSSRWQTLDIYIPKMYLPLFHNRPSRTAQNDPGMLQRLQLDGFRLATKSEVAFSNEGDLLKPMVLVLGPLFVRPLRIDWGHVTSLTCDALFMDECLELIRLAPKMSDFNVEVIAGHDNFALPQIPIIHTRLRKLVVAHDDDIFVISLFSKLTLPSLESFVYEFFGEPRIPVNAFTEFFVQSLPPLRHISLARAWMYGRNFVDLMACVPQLEEAEIVQGKDANPPYINHFLRVLAETSITSHSSSGVTFLPRLRSLKYKYEGHETLAFRYIPTVFGQRAKAPDGATGTNGSDNDSRRPMQSLTITIEPAGPRTPEADVPHPSKTTIERLLKLIESEGKTISISHSGYDLLRPHESVVLEDSDW